MGVDNASKMLVGRVPMTSFWGDRQVSRQVQGVWSAVRGVSRSSFQARLG